MNKITKIIEEKKFEKYLQDIHAKDYQGTDDDMPDDFDIWLENVDIDEMMKYAETFATSLSKALLKGVAREIEKMNKQIEPLITDGDEKITYNNENDKSVFISGKYQSLSDLKSIINEAIKEL